MKTISLKQFIEENTPEGMVYDAENSTPENVVFKEKIKSTRWEDLDSITGFGTSINSEIAHLGWYSSNRTNKNIYATRDQCEAHLAQAQLSQIMKHVNREWEPDWNDQLQVKWCIALIGDGYYVDSYRSTRRFLAFKTKDLAKQVLRENEDLFEQYKPLAG